MVPTPWSWPTIMNCSPWTIDTTAITAATPMMIPRAVSPARSLFAANAVRATRKLSRRYTGALVRLHAHLVGDDLPVAQHHLAVGVAGDLGLVRDQDHRVAAGVQLVEQRHDLVGGL